MTHVLNLPTMAATALYHGKAQAPSVEQFVEEAREWAIGPYASALLKGNDLPAEERAAVRRELSRFTGLSEEFLEQADLRVSPSRFYKELLRDRGLTVGRLDSRYTGRDYDNAGERPDNDPSFYGIDAGYTAAINAHGRALRENNELGVFVAQGYYDFATPFFAAEYSLNRTGMPEDQIHFEYYDSGHMMYVRDEDRTKLSADIREFIQSR